MWKEAVVAKFEVLFRAFAWMVCGKLRKLCQYNRYKGRDLNPGPPEYEAGVPPTSPRRLIIITFFYDLGQIEHFNAEFRLSEYNPRTIWIYTFKYDVYSTYCICMPIVRNIILYEYNMYL
jgi:hypothetical protein